MHIVVLGSPCGWHVQRCAEAGRELGHQVEIVPFQGLSARFDAGRSTLDFDGFDLTVVDRVLIRGIPPGSLEQIVFRMDALHRLQAAGVRLLNPPRAIECCVDKYLTTARLHAAGIPVPRTFVCENLDEALQALDDLGRDVVIKPLFGSEGRGMLRAECEALAYRALRTLFKLDSVLYLQEFVTHPGFDVRALVLGNRVAAAMRRFVADDFRANAGRAQRCEAWDLPAEWTDLALRSACAVGAPLAGVDLIPRPDGSPVVIEVNSTPGFQSLAAATGIDIAREIMQFLASDEWDA